MKYTFKCCYELCLDFDFTLSRFTVGQNSKSPSPPHVSLCTSAALLSRLIAEINKGWWLFCEFT